MAHIYDTTFQAEYQGFICEKIEKEGNGKNIFRFRSNRQSIEVVCPYCGGDVSGNGIRKVRLTDIPLLPGIPSIYEYSSTDTDVETAAKRTRNRIHLRCKDFS
jgi:hypothetical protein